MKENMYFSGIMIKVIIFIICILSCSSCVTLIRGGEQLVTFDSSTTNTKIYIDGIYKGNTPLKINLKRNADYKVLATKEGYVPNEAMIDSKISADKGVFILSMLDIFCFLVPSLVDVGVGSVYDLLPSNIYLNMYRYNSQQAEDIAIDHELIVDEKTDSKITYVLGLVDSNIQGQIGYQDLINKLPTQQPNFYINNLNIKIDELSKNINDQKKNKQECIEKQSILDSHEQQYRSRGMIESWDSMHRTYESMIKDSDSQIRKNQQTISILSKIVKYYKSIK